MLLALAGLFLSTLLITSIPVEMDKTINIPRLESEQAKDNRNPLYWGTRRPRGKSTDN